MTKVMKMGGSLKIEFDLREGIKTKGWITITDMTSNEHVCVEDKNLALIARIAEKNNELRPAEPPTAEQINNAFNKGGI